MLAAAAFVLYATIGAAQAFYGPAIPAMQERFAITAGTAGLAVGAHFAGAIWGVCAWAALERRVPGRVLLVAAAAATAAGSGLIAVAPAWTPVLTATLLVGVGFGGLIMGYNMVFVAAFGDRAAAMLNLLFAFVGAGRVAGPLALSLLPGGDFRAAFAVTAVTAALAVPLVLAGPAPAPPVAVNPRTTAPLRRTLGAFVLLFLFYVGVEAGVGSWAPTHLAQSGHPVAVAARWTSAFWAAYTIGRVLAAGLTARLRADLVVAAAMACSVVGLVAAMRPALAPFGYVLTGFALAPVFPTGVAWFLRALPGTRGGSVLPFGSALVGGATIPPLIGHMIGTVGARHVPTALSVIAIMVTAVALWLLRIVPQRSPAADPS